MSGIKYTKLMQEEEDGLDFGSIFSYEPVAGAEMGKGWKRRATDYVNGKRFRQWNLAKTQETPGVTGYLHRSVFESALIFCCYILFTATLPFSLAFSLKFVKEFERMVVFRLGRLQDAKGPGAILILPCIDTFRRVDLRTKAFHVPPLQAVTTDGGLIELGATVYYRIKDALSAVNSIQDWNAATRTLAHTTIHRKINKKFLSDVEKEKKTIAYELMDELNRSTFSWGMEITEIELSEIKVLKEANESSATSLIKSLADPKVAGNIFQQFMKMGLGQSMIGGEMRAFEVNSDWSNASAIMTDAEKLAHQKQHKHHEPIDEDELMEVVVDKTPREPTANEVKLEFDLDKLICTLSGILSAELVSQVGYIYQINCTDLGEFYLDLKNGMGKTGRGRAVDQVPTLEPDVSITLSSGHMMEMMLGTLNPLGAYMSGRIQIEGNTRVAMKLELLSDHVKAKYGPIL